MDEEEGKIRMRTWRRKTRMMRRNEEKKYEGEMEKKQEENECGQEDEGVLMSNDLSPQK